MKKKQQNIQIILISIGLLLILITYFYYPYIKKTELIKKQPSEKIFEKDSGDKNTTFFESIKYQGLYDWDKPFTVKSKKAYILNKEPNIVYMTNMHVILHLKDGRVVNIFSNKGRYNKETYNCFFEENVNATDGEVKILAENMDLLATKNFAKIYNNVSMKHPTGTLLADKIDYNFETKYFKVSMFDDKSIKMKVLK